MAYTIFYSIPVNQYQNDGYNMAPFGYCCIGCIVPPSFALSVGNGMVLHLTHRKRILDAFWSEMTQDQGTEMGEYSLFTDTNMLSAHVVDANDPTWHSHWRKLFTDAATITNPNDKTFFAELKSDESVEKLGLDVFLQRLNHPNTI